LGEGEGAYKGRIITFLKKQKRGKTYPKVFPTIGHSMQKFVYRAGRFEYFLSEYQQIAI
jgi:hypothetical protein